MSQENVAKKIAGGNCTFTLESLVTGSRATFKVRKFKKSEYGFGIYRMYGNDNHSDFRFIGVLNTKLNDVFKPKNQKSEEKWLSHFRWTYKHLITGTFPEDKARVLFSNTCCKCGRKLTTPESILSGIGPECSKFFSLT